MQPAAPNDEPPPRPVLKRIDQAVLACIGLVSIASLGAYWLVGGGATGRLIEIDRARPLSVQFHVDVNQADWPELSVLPEVGETLARRIVESRTAEGPYVDLEDLLRVRGIGPRTLERIRPYLRPMANTGEVAGQ